MSDGDLVLIILAVILCSWVAPVLGLLMFVMLVDWWNGDRP